MFAIWPTDVGEFRGNAIFRVKGKGVKSKWLFWQQTCNISETGQDRTNYVAMLITNSKLHFIRSAFWRRFDDIPSCFTM